MTKLRKNIVICDAGPVIHLDELECLGLLGDFQQVFLPFTVWKEIGKYRPKSINRQDLPLLKSPYKIPVDGQLFTMCRVFALHAGEIEALALMERNPKAIFLTDDCAARLVGERMGFKVHGTIGILIRSIRRAQMKPKEVLDILKQIPARSSLHIKPSLLEEIMLKIRKEFGLWSLYFVGYFVI